MRAVVLRAPGDIGVDTVPDPAILDPGDAIVQVSATAICGADLFPFHGFTPGFENGTILGHVDGIAAEHGGDAGLQLHGLGQAQQVAHDGSVDALAAIVEQPAVGFELEISPTIGVGGEQITQMYTRRRLGVFNQGFPDRRRRNQIAHHFRCLRALGLVVLKIPFDEALHTCLDGRARPVTDVLHQRLDIGPGVGDIAGLQGQ